LARGITSIQNGDTVAEMEGCRPSQGKCLVSGITGAPGAGKSTLINALIRHYRSLKRSVAVISVDPSSPASGGSLLGDRLRMSEHACDEGVFIRSVAARGHLGGLCVHIDKIVRLVESHGWDEILVETVGTGQSEVEIAGIADISIVVNTPGTGDAVQALKAGILEIADILVVNKSDLDGVEQTVNDLRESLRWRPSNSEKTEIVQTVASTGQGIEELATAIDRLRSSA